MLCAVMSQATRATVAHITLHVHTQCLHENPYSFPGCSHTVDLCVGSLIPGDVCTGEPGDEPTVINHTVGYMHRRAWGRAYCYQSHCRIHAQESLGKSLLLSITL